MSRPVITVRKGTSVEEAVRLMADYHISGLPVVDVDDRVVGIVSEKDLLLRGMAPESLGHSPLPFTERTGGDPLADTERRSRSTTVGEAMSTRVVAFEENSSVADIARAMVKHNINRVPVLREGKVVGIISRGDVIRSMAAMQFEEDDTADVDLSRPRLTL